MRTIGLSLVVLSIGGCGSAHTPERPVEREILGSRVEIDLVPQTRWEVNPFYGNDLHAEGGLALSMDTAAPFAVGEGYPSQVTLALGSMTIARCSYAGQHRIESVTGAGGGVTAEQVGADEVLIGVAPDAAPTTVRIEGTFAGADPFGPGGCTPSGLDPDLRDAPFVIELQVTAREVHGVDLDWARRECGSTEGHPHHTRTPLAVRGYRPIDAAGDSFAPVNAVRSAPVHLVLSAPEGREFALDADHEGTLRGVLMPAEATVIDVSARSGPGVAVEVVDASGVSAIEPVFSLLGDPVGFRSLAGSDLASQAIWDATSLELSTDRVWAYVDSYDGPGPTCTGPSPDEFVLESRTPDVCAPASPIGSGSDDPHRPPIGQAQVLADGDCHLVWSAPGLAGGAGLEGELRVELRNVEALVPVSD